MTLYRQYIRSVDLEQGLDTLVWVGGLNTGSLYSDSGKIQIGCILSSGKIRTGVFQFYGFWVNQMCLEHLLVSYFSFVKIKILAYLLLKTVCI